MTANYEGCDCGGEHRTVGPHRAWCLDCHEWCYPSAICEIQDLRNENAQMREALERLDGLFDPKVAAAPEPYIRQIVREALGR